MPAAAIPSTKSLQPMLREVTECLARELVSPSPRPPDWSELHWTLARAVAAMHGVSPLLSQVSRWPAPSEWTQFLSSQWQHTAHRHLRIQSLLKHLDAGARQRAIAVTALKGTALHDLSLYCAGERPMADIDVLVRPAELASLCDLLRSIGYEQSNASFREIVFSPLGAAEPSLLGEHADNAVKIEVHERIGEQLAWRITDTSSCIFPAQTRAGLNSYDSKAALMGHLLLHAAGSMSRKGLRLLQMHDIALLAARMTPQDWSELLHWDTRGCQPWWAFPPLQLTQRYYGAPIPADVLLRFAAVCPLWLRAAALRYTLYDVSLSYPWVDAFPAMAWSRSVAESCAYIVNRLVPRGEVMAARERTRRTEPWARRTRWAGLSQGRRILSWAASRPARPATLQALTAVFS